MNVKFEIDTIFALLKEHLKAKQISYSKLAEKMSMSESNIKRIFSTRSCSLQQVAQICSAADTSFVNLAAIASKKISPDYCISKEAEEFFLGNFDAFIFYRHLFAAMDAQTFISSSNLPKERVSSYLKKFENLGLVTKKGGRIKVVGDGYLNFSKTPKLKKLLQEKWIPWFIDQTLRNSKNPEYYLNITSTGLSKTHRAQLIDDIERVLQRYRDIGTHDQTVGAGDFESVGLCIGIGPHRIGFFEDKETMLPSRRY